MEDSSEDSSIGGSVRLSSLEREDSSSMDDFSSVEDSSISLEDEEEIIGLMVEEDSLSELSEEGVEMVSLSEVSWLSVVSLLVSVLLVDKLLLFRTPPQEKSKEVNNREDNTTGFLFMGKPSFRSLIIERAKSSVQGSRPNLIDLGLRMKEKPNQAVGRLFFRLLVFHQEVR